MDFIATFLKELDQECTTTRKMLERIPVTKFNFKPHDKSMDMRRLATHIAELPGWMMMAITTDELNFEETPYKPEDVKNTEELVNYFDRTVKAAILVIAHADEKEFSKPWILRNGDEIYGTFTKAELMRHAMSQTIHHRAQLGVYLRLNDIPLPSSYMGSADEF